MQKLFIDDERFPATGDFVIVRSFRDATDYMEEAGCPDYISFDHDLGEEHTGLDVAKWMIERDLDFDGKFMPTDFRFYVHSQNPIGGVNITKFLNSYLSSKN